MALLHSILVRLRGTGWEKDVDFMREGQLEIMSNLPVVRQSSKLTEGGKDASYLLSVCMLIRCTMQRGRRCWSHSMDSSKIFEKTA